MTTYVRDPSVRGGVRANAEPASRGVLPLTRPRWLLPGIVAALIVGGLVIAGVVSLSTVIYAGLFGGMMLMHVGGHGHGAHGGGGHASHATDGEDLSPHSLGSQPSDTRSSSKLVDRVPTDSTTNETEHDDQHSSHGCH